MDRQRVGENKLTARKYFWLVLLGGLIIISAAVLFYRSIQPQVIPFVVLETGYSLIDPARSPSTRTEPSLIILSSQEEMLLVDPLIFPEALAKTIKQVDFQKSFVILAQHGHAEGGLITKVTRQASTTIVITTTDMTAGPGNYVKEEWTQPYEVIQIDKGSGWGQEIRFILQRETQGIVGEATHFIP